MATMGLPKPPASPLDNQRMVAGGSDTFNERTGKRTSTPRTMPNLEKMPTVTGPSMSTGSLLASPRNSAGITGPGGRAVKPLYNTY